MTASFLTHLATTRTVDGRDATQQDYQDAVHALREAYARYAMDGDDLAASMALALVGMVVAAAIKPRPPY